MEITQEGKEGRERPQTKGRRDRRQEGGSDEPHL